MYLSNSTLIILNIPSTTQNSRGLHTVEMMPTHNIRTARSQPVVFKGISFVLSILQIITFIIITIITIIIHHSSPFAPV